METTRPHAPYLPSNLDFVAKNNAFSPDQLKHNFLNGTFIAVIMGFFSGNTVSLPVDPRQRMSSPKANPSRTFTPEGTAGWGGSCLSIYPSDSPGGYMMLGQTIPCFDLFGYKAGFSPERPWLFQDFDLIDFERVSEAEIDSQLLRFRAGTYEWQWEPAEFDMAEHNKLLVDTADEVKEMRARQAKAQDEMTAAEADSLARWREEKAQSKVDVSSIESMLNGAYSNSVEPHDK
jgi:urea carboxylase